jgi:molybdate transport system ATP-binding protein
MISIQAQLNRGNFCLDVNTQLNERVTAIFGPSGSGKSTLLNCIAGITRPDAGQIFLGETCLFDSNAKINVPIFQRQIGLVFQEGRLFPHLTIEKNLKYGIKNTPQLSNTIQLSFEELVELLELSKLLKQQPHQLSGGEKQRVALGRALLSAPKLLMLDEPLASLDQRLKDQILPFLKLVADEINIPMIYISHDKNEIAQITQHVVAIEHGKIKS